MRGPLLAMWCVVHGPVLGANAWCGCGDKHRVILLCLSPHPAPRIGTQDKVARLCVAAANTGAPAPVPAQADSLRRLHTARHAGARATTTTARAGGALANLEINSFFFIFLATSSPSRKVAHFGLNSHIKTCAFRQPISFPFWALFFYGATISSSGSRQ